MDTLDAIRIDTEHIDLERFLEMDDATRKEIANIQIIPPRLGDESDFGSLLVDWKTPRYHVDL